MIFNSTTTTTSYPTRWQPKSKILREKRLINQAMNKSNEQLFKSILKGMSDYQITSYSTKEKT